MLRIIPLFLALTAFEQLNQSLAAPASRAISKLDSRGVRGGWLFSVPSVFSVVR